MKNIFRKFRLNTIKNKKVLNYLTYSVGEIVLVVIGIFIAITLNKWTEHNKDLKLIDNNLKTLYKDLSSDTIEINKVIEIFDSLEQPFQKIINNEYSVKEVKNCRRCMSLVTVYIPFVIETRAYNIVKTYNSDNNYSRDTLLNTITQFYSSNLNIHSYIDQLIKDNVQQNLLEWQNEKTWFAEGFASKEGPMASEDFLNYVANDPIYRNKVALQSIYIYKNLIPFMKNFKAEADTILKALENRLELEH